MSQKESKSTQKKSKDYLQLSIKPEGLNNISFSVADEIYEKDLVKIEQYRQQRFERGFDDTETWHMDRTMALFIIPRLKRFIEVNNGIPNGETEESYDEKIKFIISAFENYYVSDKYFNSVDIEERKKLTDDVRQAVEYLSKLWFELWW
jgi:hypothetical protein